MAILQEGINQEAIRPTVSAAKNITYNHSIENTIILMTIIFTRAHISQIQHILNLSLISIIQMLKDE